MLAITEKWVRNKVQLEFNQLHNVRSLILPGTQGEKINYLGGSLQNFVRLKNLDLSGNSLVSLEGLEHLLHLEKLNIYRNKIGNLTVHIVTAAARVVELAKHRIALELFRLRHNQNLISLDVRLNPVCRSDPNYRLFLIQLLPNLVKLDDLSVMPAEREAARELFTSDQIDVFTPSTSHAQSGLPSTHNLDHKAVSSNPGLLKMPMNMLDDLLADTDASFTGSRIMSQHAFMDEVTKERTPESDLVFSASSKKSPTDHGNTSVVLGSHTKTPEKSTKDVEHLDLLSEAVASLIPLVDSFYRPGMSLGFQFRAKAAATLQEILLRPIEAKYDETINLFRADLQAATDKNSELENTVKMLYDSEREVRQLYKALGTECEAVLSSASIDANGTKGGVVDMMKVLVEELTSARDDTAKLREQIAVASSESTIAGDICKDAQKSRDNAIQECTRLKAEIVSLKEDLNQCHEKQSKQEAELESLPQMRELIQMLRESHRSLKTTNEAAMKQLSDERKKHQTEIEHLKWNYNELKRTTDLLIS